MGIAEKADYKKELQDNQRRIYDMVIEGINQVKKGQVQDADVVLERLEKKYQDAL